MVIVVVRMHRKLLPALFANPGLAGVLLICAAAAHAATPDFFATRLYPVLDKAGCKYCHYSDGVASATRLHFPADGASIQMIEEFGRSLVEVMDRAEPEKSLLLNKPTNRVRHSGGERIKRGSGEE